jgi:arylformamidase
MPAWPTGRAVLTHRVVDEGGTSSPRNSEWRLDSHAGTHVDAPLHWLPGGADADAIPLIACFGSATVVDAAGHDRVSADVIPQAALRRGHRVLLRTDNSERRLARQGGFHEDFVALAPDAAELFARAAVALVGVDYLSVESPAGDGSVHRTLLRAGIVLLEGLDLSEVAAGDYNLIALPLRLQGGEASPVRAILWR